MEGDRPKLPLSPADIPGLDQSGTDVTFICPLPLKEELPPRDSKPTILQRGVES